jgi:hypothetical protein
MHIYKNLHELITNVKKILKKSKSYDTALNKISNMILNEKKIGKKKAKQILLFYIDDYVYIKENINNSNNNEQDYYNKKINILNGIH